MKTLIVGISKSNHNFRKIEGFYFSFSKISSVEWVQNLFDCTDTEYDLVFSEMDIDEIFNKNEEYKKIKIKNHLIWSTVDLSKLISASELNPEVNYIIAYKSNVLNKNILTDYKNKFGGEYQKSGGEGILVDDFLNLDTNLLPKNVEIIYLPCCISVKEDFYDEKEYDICYFGTLHNRPKISEILNNLSKKYKVITSNSSHGKVRPPHECYELYKRSKTTLSEQVNPVVLEYPVRLGEATSTGCKVFLLEEIPLFCENILIPNHFSSRDVNFLTESINEYIEFFSIENSKEIYNNFNSTYDSAVDYILTKLKK